jgi:hypothetical protein
MSGEASMHDNKLKRGYDWHLEFRYSSNYPYPFPIMPMGTRNKHDPVGHLSHEGRVHIFNDGIIEQLVLDLTPLPRRVRPILIGTGCLASLPHIVRFEKLRGPLPSAKRAREAGRLFRYRF